MTSGILAVWSDITPEAAEDYDAWYEQDHMFERLVVDGFHRARHYRTVAGAQQFFTYFVTDNAAVMQSPAYVQSANNSTPWTQRILPNFRNTNRTAFNVIRRIGWGYGAASMTIRIAVQHNRETELIRWLGQEQLPSLLERPGIIGAQLWAADIESTRVPVQDSGLRPAPDLISALAVFIEATGLDAIESVAKGPLAEAHLTVHGADSGALISIHQLMNSAEKDVLPDI